METLLLVSVIALWIVVLINLLLTLRMVQWHRAIKESREQEVALEQRPELVVGEAAPDFRSRLLTGASVRLENYQGRTILLLFVSPGCSGCRKKMPQLLRLSMLAKERSGVEFLLVSAGSSAETYTWISALREEDHLDVKMPILVEVPRTSEFLMRYNPRGFIPYFCLIDEQGIVQARDPLDAGVWPRLQQEWEGTTPQRILSRRARL
ncbi:hypothetical protein KDH_08320 [Dictyobacter sp. S3.2.2.5]|uniref:Thioredoxin domain-containing protein n=1 Tax=Dictyobacter halimunensis TaxID=3026934 RepID=A0ABQ6FN78_9CHLR|nr:hypothetical protein KDH_08320 [Dictyobacter sp. S3.2.2.5]